MQRNSTNLKNVRMTDKLFVKMSRNPAYLPSEIKR